MALIHDRFLTRTRKHSSATSPRQSFPQAPGYYPIERNRMKSSRFVDRCTNSESAKDSVGSRSLEEWKWLWTSRSFLIFRTANGSQAKEGSRLIFVPRVLGT